MNPWVLFCIAWLGAAIVMVLVWIIQRQTDDAGIVDVAWAALIGVISTFFALFSDGNVSRRILIAALASIWALRLSIYLFVRTLRLPEDGRYQKLRTHWGPNAQKYLFVFFQIQASWAVVFALPMLIASHNAESTLDSLDYMGFTIWAVAICGELIVDRQLYRFRTDRSNEGKVCKVGLWRYSRHPNYFFEWIHWWAYVAIGWGAPYGALTLIGPALMLFFLFKVTGIPPNEENSLASRRDAYREYQRTTSIFYPWPPKQD